MHSLPRIDARYWACLVAASVFGTNTGDAVADFLHLGHLAGLPWLAALFAGFLLLDRVLRLSVPVLFWAAIITVRTAATNIGDAFHQFHIGFEISLPLMTVLFVAAVALYWLRPPGDPEPDHRVQVTSGFWVRMTLAGALGTIAGDVASFGLHLTPPGAALAGGVLVALALRTWRGEALRTIWPYWVTVVLIRTAGTSAGDALAHALGLAASTWLTGLVFAGLVLWCYVIQRPAALGTSAAATLRS